jgi:dihydrofolate reductase
MPFHIIAAISNVDRGIGCNGKLPWNIKEDMEYFSRITQTTKNPRLRNAIIMGRKTFDSIGRRPLRGRLNICISTSGEPGITNSTFFCRSLDEAIQLASRHESIENIFVIGGETIYKQAIEHPLCATLFVNEVNCDDDVKCDTFFPDINLEVYELKKDFDICSSVRGMVYERKQI